jgi:hypothetical protein
MAREYGRDAGDPGLKRIEASLAWLSLVNGTLARFVGWAATMRGHGSSPLRGTECASETWQEASWPLTLAERTTLTSAGKRL